jgi:hypothetical protein
VCDRARASSSFRRSSINRKNHEHPHHPQSFE